MNKPLVSIIIPTFNRSKHLQRAIHSALNQTYENIEIIIIDDNSYDDTATVVKNFKDPRIHYYKNSENKGPTFTRNKGLSLSKGEYINFLDDDDILLPKKIELQIKKFKESEIENLGVVTCDVYYSQRDRSGIKRNRKKGYIYKDLLKKYCIHGTHPLLIKREFIKYFDLNLTSNQEYDLEIRLSRICNFDYVPKCLAIKYESKNQITFNYKKKIIGTRYFYKKYVSEFKRYGLFFFIFNWLRFKYLLFKYYLSLILIRNPSIEKSINKIHNILFLSSF